MSIKTFIDRPITSVMVSVTIVILGIISLISLPLEQFPDIAPPTVKVSATYTGANAETVMKSVVTPLEASINGVENMQYMTSTASNNGTCVVTSVVNEIYHRTASIKEAQVNCGTLPMIRGYGSKSGFDLYLQNRSGEDFQALSDVTTQFVDKLNQRPEISKANCTFNMNYPQYEVSVDATKCLMHNVSPKDVLAALSSYVGGDYASNLNK